MNKGFLFKIHSFSGLLSGIFVIAMSLSGAMLVFHDELAGLQYPSVVTIDNKPLLPVDSCYRSLQKQYAHAQISSCNLAHTIDEPFIFTVYDSSFQNGTQSMQVFIHPQTGEILKFRSGGKDFGNNFIGWLSIFHNSFHLKKKGEWLLGFFGIIFLVSIITGVILYRKSIFSVLLFRKYMFRKANLHQLIGVYAILFNLVIGITGVWMQRYVFKKDFYATEQKYTPMLTPSAPLSFSIDNALNNVYAQYTAFTGHVIYFAPNKKRKTAVYGSNATNTFIHNKKLADAIFLDSTGRIIKTAFVNDIAVESRYDIINAQIHYGRYGGWPVKLLYSLFGLTGGLLSITGFIFWGRRS